MHHTVENSPYCHCKVFCHGTIQELLHILNTIQHDLHVEFTLVVILLKALESDRFHSTVWDFVLVLLIFTPSHTL